MANRTLTGFLPWVLAAGLSGCDSARVQGPAAPSPIPAVAPPAEPVLRTFTDAGSCFSTTDVRDARDHVVQFDTSYDLIWTADGRHLPGFYSKAGSAYIDGFAASQNWFIVRFGMTDGQRRAYLTAVDDEGLNPGTLVGLDVSGTSLVVVRTNVFPPGTYTLSGYTLSGVVTEVTPIGRMPIAGAFVMLTYGAGDDYQRATTDGDGGFEIRALYESVKGLNVYKEGYKFLSQPVSVDGDTRVDLRLLRQ
jgi:hypothetical protein